MTKILNTKSGFTLIEVLVSVGIILIFLPYAANMLTNSRLLSSYSKHKIQAAYAAQLILETQRQSAFRVIAANNSVIVGPSAVLLDNKGNYNNTNCNSPNVFCGTSVITITPKAYTATNGVLSTSTTVDHLVVQVYWNERISKFFIPITETFAEDIVNDTMLN